jgi:hypothetical protein
MVLGNHGEILIIIFDNQEILFGRDLFCYLC